MQKKIINKSDLIARIAEKYNLNPHIADKIVRAILNAMENTLEDKRRIEIRGFGSFELRYREPRTARNPKTGSLVQTPGKYVVHFKPGKEMRDRVNATVQTHKIK